MKMTRFDLIKASGIIEEDVTAKEFAEIFTLDLDCNRCGITNDYCSRVFYGDDYEKLSDFEKERRSWHHTCKEVMEKYLLEEV